MLRNEDYFRWLFEFRPDYHAVVSARGRRRIAENRERAKKDPVVIAQTLYEKTQRERRAMWEEYKKGKIRMDKGTRKYPIIFDTKNGILR